MFVTTGLGERALWSTRGLPNVKTNEHASY